MELKRLVGLVLDESNNAIIIIDIKQKSERDYMLTALDDQLPLLTDKLLEIRCPYERVSKSDEKVYKCNSLCVRVTPNSAGEARCRKCGLNFLFGTREDAEPQTGVRAQPIQ